MDLIATSAKEEGGEHVHGWENVSLVEKEAVPTVVILKNELEALSSFSFMSVCLCDIRARTMKQLPS
jgi:hypothetical protein